MPEGCKVMAVVKANAYGHGDVQVATTLQKLGVYDFTVSNIDEACALRKSGIQGQILILGYTPPNYADMLLKYDITQALVLEEYADALINTGLPIKCQYAIDTGMRV
ncbi:alanine racemase [Enterocloster clostridioformis]|uniref:alanine racemase n=1 Tax=Enterocloster clostridioformis TaxID=1531 RepID=UPI00242A4380|nr:alanine racemase [Enterocloster clostridioformis]MDB2128407.1 alanine racemase [Enterocloster clostridioformis]